MCGLVEQYNIQSCPEPLSAKRRSSSLTDAHENRGLYTLITGAIAARVATSAAAPATERNTCTTYA